jgi:hypothetical protein
MFLRAYDTSAAYDLFVRVCYRITPPQRQHHLLSIRMIAGWRRHQSPGWRTDRPREPCHRACHAAFARPAEDKPCVTSLFDGGLM